MNLLKPFVAMLCIYSSHTWVKVSSKTYYFRVFGIYHRSEKILIVCHWKQKFFVFRDVFTKKTFSFHLISSEDEVVDSFPTIIFQFFKCVMWQNHVHISLSAKNNTWMFIFKSLYIRENETYSVNQTQYEPPPERPTRVCTQQSYLLDYYCNLLLKKQPSKIDAKFFHISLCPVIGYRLHFFGILCL